LSLDLPSATPHRNFIPSEKFPSLPKPDPGPSFATILEAMSGFKNPK
jgi:hypothetical protein